MASLKSFGLILVILAVVATEMQMGGAQTCGADVSNLQVCAPFVLPGAANTNPSTECCRTLQSVNKDCLCNALRVAATLPSHCGVPPLGCDIST